MFEERGPILIFTSFSEKGRACAKRLQEFLELMELPCVLGETFGGIKVSKGVQGSIEDAWFVIAILPCETKVNDDTWRTSEWMMQELAYAEARKKDFLILLENGVRFTNGILGDVECLPFETDKFDSVLVPLGRQVRAFLNRRLLTIGVKKVSVYTHVSDEQIRNECADEAKLLILEIRDLAKQHRYEEASGLAMKATQVDPKCWRAWTSLGTLLVQRGEVDNGDAIFLQVLKDFSNDHKGTATALHNRAWVQEIRCGISPSASGIRKQSRLYEKALKLDDSRVNTRACLLINRLLLEETDKAERLMDESLMYEGFLDALRYELDTRGSKVHKASQALPTWLKKLLYPVHPSSPNGEY